MLNNLENLVSLNPSGIPDALRAHDHWVAWIAVPNKKSGGYSKPPLSIKNGCLASPTKPEDWGSYDSALAYYEAHRGKKVASGTVCGLGIALTESMGIVAVDLDGCVQDGKISDSAAAIVESLGGLAELSPSGTGVHIFVRAVLPPDAPKRKGDVEIYNNRRYLTVTGRWLGKPEDYRPDDLPSGPDIQAALDALIASMREPHGEKWQERQSTEEEKKEKPAAGGEQASPSGAGMREPHGGERQSTEVIERLRRENPKFAALFDAGDTAAYNGDDSAADLALCNVLAWAGCDAAAIDVIFRQSRLMRPKWDELRGGKTYGELTIAKAIESVAEKKKKQSNAQEKSAVDTKEACVDEAPRSDVFGIGLVAEPCADAALLKFKDFVYEVSTTGYLSFERGQGPEDLFKRMTNVLKHRGDVTGDAVMVAAKDALGRAMNESSVSYDIKSGLGAVAEALSSGSPVKSAAPKMTDDMTGSLVILWAKIRAMQLYNFVPGVINAVFHALKETPDLCGHQKTVLQTVRDGMEANKHLARLKEESEESRKAHDMVAMLCVNEVFSAFARPRIDIPDDFLEFAGDMPAQTVDELNARFYSCLKKGKKTKKSFLCLFNGELRALTKKHWVRYRLYSAAYVVECEDADTAGQWHLIDGETKVWSLCSAEKIRDLIRAAIDEIGDEEDDAVSAKIIQSFLEDLRSVRRRSVTMMDTREGGVFRIACQNGLVEPDGNGGLRLRDIRIDDNVVSVVNATWRAADDPELVAALPRVKDILWSFVRFDDDGEDKRTAFLESAGSAMLQRAPDVAWLYIGSGANGKGIWQKYIESLVGKKNYVTINKMRDLGNEHVLYDLRGATCAICTETRPSDNMDVDAFNNITTGDTVQGRKLYRDPVYYRPYATILIFSNHYPSFNDDSIGPMRRIIALRMNREFVHADGSRAEDYSETIDREIAEPIMRDALFRMAVEAVWNAATRGWEWTRPASSLRESALIRSATSTLRQFWEEFLVPDPAGCLPATVPFTCYAASCRDKLIDKKDFLTYGKFRNEAGMQLKVGIEQDSNSKAWFVNGYRLRKMLEADVGDRHDKTELTTLEIGIRMSVARMSGLLRPVAPGEKSLVTAQKIRAAVTSGITRIVDSLSVTDSEGNKVALTEEQIVLMLREHLVIRPDKLVGFAMERLDDELFSRESKEEREAHYIALAASDGLWLASMPAAMQKSLAVCLAAVRQNRDAIKFVYAKVRGEAETADEFLAAHEPQPE